MVAAREILSHLPQQNSSVPEARTAQWFNWQNWSNWGNG